MMTFLRNIFVCLTIATISIPAFCEETIWLRGTFKEINTSSPVVGEATFPLELTRAVIAATPPKFLEEAMLSGFDIPVLFQSVEAMPVGETFELNKEEYQLRIEKFVVNEPEPKESRLMLIHLEEPNGTTKIPVPLALTSTAIPLLQLALKELNGMEDQLAKLIEEVRKTTPGLILTGQDKLMYTKLDIKLQQPKEFKHNMTSSTELNPVQTLFQETFGNAIRFQEPLAPYTSIHIGGPAEMFLEITDVDALVKAYRLALDHKIRIWFLAGCSNVLIHDGGLSGLVLINKTNRIIWDDDNLQITVDGGFNLDQLIFEISNRGWSDITFAAGIPGSLGGALIGGAGAFGNLVHSFLLEADIMRPNGERLTVPVEDLGIEYRTSAAKKRGDIILTAKMGNFEMGDRDKNLAEIKRIKTMRDEKHPTYGNSYSAGSFFKNLPPEEPGGWRIPAGKLLDECDCRGLRVGGAGVFEKHANIIVNYGDATCADVNELANEMAARVKAKFNIDLEREVQYLFQDIVMANPEQLEILKSGVENWNKWRDENRDVEIDLCHETYDSLDLSNFNFINSNLRHSIFKHTNLQNIQAFQADFSHSDLTSAFLDNANFLETLFINADLSYTSFDNAYLSMTTLTSVLLFKADFKNAIFSNTFILYNDLSETLNLNKSIHHHNSAIDIHTIYKSKGNIPIEFLRGVGMDDQMISFVQSLKGAIQFYSCFISYSHQDEDFAKHLYDKLQGQNIRCWLASEDLKTGDRFKDSINEAIRFHDKLLIILSEHSVKSDWVETEVYNAMEKEKKTGKLVLFPIRIDNAAMDDDAFWVKDLRNKRHITDFSKWKDHDEFEKAFQKITADLKASENNAGSL